MSTAVSTERVTLDESQAQTAARILASVRDPSAEVLIRTSSPEPVMVPSEMVLLLHGVLDAITRGRTVTISTMSDELTTSAAADILGISRQALVKMIKTGRIPAHMVGTHHRLRSRDVLEARRARQARERAASIELLGMGEG